MINIPQEDLTMLPTNATRQSSTINIVRLTNATAFDDDDDDDDGGLNTSFARTTVTTAMVTIDGMKTARSDDDETMKRVLTMQTANGPRKPGTISVANGETKTRNGPKER